MQNKFFVLNRYKIPVMFLLFSRSFNLLRETYKFPFFFFLFSYLYGKTLVPEVEGGPQPTVHMIWTPVPQSVTLPGDHKEQRWEFLTAIAETEEDVQRTFCEGMSLIGSGSLYLSHVQAWAALWEGCCVDVDGPLSLSQAIYGCLYYLLSAIPPPGSAGFPFSGISPGGLSNGTSGEDYWGHVFWDQVSKGHCLSFLLL